MALSLKHANEVAKTIMGLFQQFPFNVKGSWGIHNYKADIIEDMGALSFLVQGFDFKGRIWVALNEGKDLFEIWGQRKGSSRKVRIDEDVFFEDLCDILDSIIETGENGKMHYEKATPIGLALETIAENEPSPSSSIPLSPSNGGHSVADHPSKPSRFAGIAR